MEYQDKEMTCVDCGNPFTWTAGEQKFMNHLKDEGRISEIKQPKRCMDCREAKKKKFDGQQNQQSNKKWERPVESY